MESYKKCLWRSVYEVFWAVLISIEMDETDDEMLWNDSEEDGNIRHDSEEDEDTACEDGNSNIDWSR